MKRAAAVGVGCYLADMEVVYLFHLVVCGWLTDPDNKKKAISEGLYVLM